MRVLQSGTRGSEDARALDEGVAKLGRLDALVNVAGTFRWEKLSEGSVETWDLLYRANLRSAVSASHAALPHLLPLGRAARHRERDRISAIG